VGLVQVAYSAAGPGQNVLHVERIRMVRPAHPNPVVALVQQLVQRVAVMPALAGPDGQFQPRLERADVIVSQNLPLSVEHLGQ
jgi:hypothetical protein